MPDYGRSRQSTNSNNEQSVEVSEIQRKELEKLIKIGVYKELYKKNVLTESQLDLLIKESSVL
ncbi:hypothetical protein C3B58_04035 [Lactonifactor longoviformis]|uniref:Uncharacterized protein n=1 Tax=Lactonifactor longoviformis DSM 17459 TaxID=1122155 RepID=A0A1M4VLS8_9CLOT|nr:hypothetical protein [Lactonifactor longoviformis]POP34188.1 hypothetical protein C3B58_04035 [Lactonifactor longoviformis]SHE69817.1 hypothetical protein SAMN02745158_01287 [Lactonifactor longoviformis DSM 17459]